MSEKKLVQVFRHFDLPNWWNVEFLGEVSFGMEKRDAIRFASQLAYQFGARMVVKRNPGLKKVAR